VATLILRYDFHDFDEYAGHIAQGEVEHSQLDQGKFYGKLCQVISKEVIVSTHSSNRVLLQKGNSLDGFTTFLIPGNMEQDFTWRKERLKGNRLGILRPGMEHQAVILPNFFGVPVSVHNDLLQSLSDFLGYPQFMSTLFKHETLEIGIPEARQLHQMVISLCNAKRVDQEALEVELPSFIICSIAKACMASERGQRKTSRDVTFVRALEYIFEHMEGDISITSLSRSLGVSERTLRYMFTEKTSLSPKKFIHSLKLNMIRKELKTSSSPHNIFHSAVKFGFWHSGQFAADYRRLFGELPSNTKEQLL
jgi:AraC family ethanolamine operon transcriptional activator